MRSFAILLVASLTLESAQTQAGGKKEPAIAEGQVVSSATGEPVVRARVTIRPKIQSTNPEDAPGGFTMQTDDSGTYHFEKLESGKYEIFVIKAGYLRANYGAKRVNGPGLPIELQSGQTVGKLDVKLYPEATISGVVTDEHGDPLQSSVQLVKRGWKQGKPMLLPSNFSNADTRGRFHFSGVEPGKYYVKAQPRELSSQHQPQEVDRQGNLVNLHLVSTFYGDTAGLEGAVALQVQPGQEVADVNIKMRREAVFHIRGRIVSVPPGDSPLNYSPILIADESSFFFERGSARPKNDGQFEVDNVQPGSYLLMMMRGGMSPGGSYSLPVEISDASVDNLEISIPSPADIHGRLVVDDQSSPDLSTAQVYLSKSGGMFFSGGNTVAAADGSFTLRDVAPGHYRVSVQIPGQELFVRSVRAGSREMLDKSIDLSQGAGPIEIVLSFSPAKLEGTVARDDPDSHTAVAASAINVVLIPENRTDEFYGGIKSASTDGKGHFTFHGVEPGHYKAFAADGIDMDQWTDPELAKALDNRGVEVELNEKDSKQIQLKLITQEEASQVLTQLGL